MFTVGERAQQDVVRLVRNHSVELSLIRSIYSQMLLRSAVACSMTRLGLVVNSVNLLQCVNWRSGESVKLGRAGECAVRPVFPPKRTSTDRSLMSRMGQKQSYENVLGYRVAH